MRIDGAASGGGSQQLRIARLWEDVTPGTGDEGDERDGGWRLRGRPVIKVRDKPCAYCGRALDDPIDGLEGMNAPVRVPCDHGGRVHGLCMLERADLIACGSADPRPRIACQSEWPLGKRPPNPAELAGAMAANEEEADGRWPRTFEALRFSTIVSQEPSQLDQTEYRSTGVYNTLEDMLRAQGHCATAWFLLCTLVCDTLGPPSGVYIECPHPLGWTQVVDRNFQLFRTKTSVPKTLFCAFREHGSISAPTRKSSLCTWTLFGMSA